MIGLGRVEKGLHARMIIPLKTAAAAALTSLVSLANPAAMVHWPALGFVSNDSPTKAPRVRQIDCGFLLSRLIVLWQFFGQKPLVLNSLAPALDDWTRPRGVLA